MAFAKSQGIRLASIALILPLLLATALLALLPAQAHAAPSTSEIYTVSNVDYRASQDGSTWYAVVQSGKNTSSLTIPETVKLDGTTCEVKAIFPGAFNSCDKLKTLTIKAPIEYFPISMCYGCTSLQTVTLSYPDNVTEVMEGAFEGCSSLKTISDLKSVTRIEEEAFRGCSSLETLVTFALRKLGENAFRDCASLTSVSTPHTSESNLNLKKIPAYAFYGCKKLKDVGNVANVTEVGARAFTGCRALSSIGLPALETVGNVAFQGCVSLAYVHLGNVKAIGSQAFENCSALVWLYCNSRLETIGTYAFRGCSSLARVEMPNTVTSVGAQAYEACTALTDIRLSNNLHSIPAKMCKGCTKLASVHMSSYVDGSIGAEAFANCTSLRSAYVTSQSVKFLGAKGAGPFSGCTNLTLYGYAPCTAKTYAAGEPGVTFVDLNDAAAPTVTVRFHASRWPDTEPATGSMPSVKTAKYGVYTLPGNEGFEYPGHTFDKWRVVNNGVESDYQPGHTIKNVEGDIACYALWREASTVTLKRSAGASAETQMSTHALGSMYYVPVCPFAVPTGQVFKYWIANDNGNGNYDEGEGEYVYYPGYSFQFDKTTPTSMTLTAKFVTPIEATFKAYSGATFADGTTEKSLLTNAEYAFDEFPEVTRYGFAFAGWQVTYDMSHTKIVGIGEPLNPYSTYQGGKQVVTLVATWKPNTTRTITLLPSGGTINGKNTPVFLTTDGEGRIADNQILGYKPVREHYKFIRWRDSAGRLFATGAFTTFTFDTALTAQWEPIQVEKITLSPTSLEIVKGMAKQLTAKVAPADALDAAVTWSSSNNSVATVSAAGKVTAVAPGSAVITCASADGGVSATCAVTVITGLAPDGTALGAGADKDKADSFLASYKKEADPAGSSYLPLRLKAAKVAKTSVKLTWKKASGAVKYVIYGSKCGKNKPVKLAILGKSKASYTWKKLSGKKLAKNTYYKAIVVALNAKGKVVSTSTMVHAATSGGTKGNCTKVTTKAKKGKVTVKAGKSFKLGAKAVKHAGKKIANHRKAAIVYVSSNNKIATVTKAGVVKGKEAGTCYVHAYAQNGVAAKVKVTVKANKKGAALTASEM